MRWRFPGLLARIGWRWIWGFKKYEPPERSEAEGVRRKGRQGERRGAGLRSGAAISEAPEQQLRC